MNITHQKYIMLRLSVVTYRPDIGFKLHGSYQSHTLLQSYASMHPANKISDHIKKETYLEKKLVAVLLSRAPWVSGKNSQYPGTQSEDGFVEQRVPQLEKA